MAARIIKTIISIPIYRSKDTHYPVFIPFLLPENAKPALLQIRARGDLPQKILCAIPPRSVKAPGPQGAGLPPSQRRQRPPTPLPDLQQRLPVIPFERSEAPPGACREGGAMRRPEGTGRNEVEGACPLHRGLSRSDWGFEYGATTRKRPPERRALSQRRGPCRT